MTPSHTSRKVEAGCRAGQGGRAFSLIEIMTVVALLSFIILGLVAMFNQTRKAFTSSMTQVDVLGSGRMAADMLGREMEQMYPVYGNLVTNFFLITPQIAPLVQPLTDSNDVKINNLQAVFFVTRNNMQWSCIGYRLGLADYNNGIGTLYRYNSTNIPTENLAPLATAQWRTFLNVDPATVPTNYYSRIIDGVVDFQVRLFATNGAALTSTNSPNIFIYTTNYYATYYGASQTGPVGYIDYPQAYFSSNALPAYVELELGVLEDRTLAKYQALTNGGVNPGSAAYNYLTSHAGQVHVFRQRIPIRNVNSSAFP